jgi:MoaA/NifB/PqqE/SkfB family radical SAM enzyme
MILNEAGPGFCHFAVTDACNASCEFCNFRRSAASHRIYVSLNGAEKAIAILYRQGIRYLELFGGEPLLHPYLDDIIRYAFRKGMRVMITTNGSLLSPGRLESAARAGASTFIISVDASNAASHEANRGLPRVCEKIREANRIISNLGLRSAASVAMSRLVDYESLPAFLCSLGFESVTFSYPLTSAHSSFRGFSDSWLVNYSPEELLNAFDSVKALKKRIRVENPSQSIEEMKRFIRKEKQLFPCLGGYKYFYLDWNLDLWRCHFLHSPLCSVFEFDGSQKVNDGCTRCMMDCFRDPSVMHHLGISFQNAYLWLRMLQIAKAVKALTKKSNIASLGAILEELSWIVRI